MTKEIQESSAGAELIEKTMRPAPDLIATTDLITEDVSDDGSVHQRSVISSLRLACGAPHFAEPAGTKAGWSLHLFIRIGFAELDS